MRPADASLASRILTTIGVVAVIPRKQSSTTIVRSLA
jgi:hypothetical protein